MADTLRRKTGIGDALIRYKWEKLFKIKAEKQFLTEYLGHCPVCFSVRTLIEVTSEEEKTHRAE